MPIPGITSRAFTGRADLRAIGALMSATWTGPRRPLVQGTVGDVVWGPVGGGPDADWPARIRIWERAGRVVAWGWFNPPGGLDWFVGDGFSAEDETAIRGEILEWFVERARHHRATSPDETGPIELETWGIEGSSEEAVLRHRGWLGTEKALSQYVQPLDVDLDPPRVPDGYTLRHVRGPDDVPARVEAHRAAFAPSRMTAEKYALLPGLDHYRFEHDLVLEAPDGSIAAFAICWLDPVGSIAEFEPVGTHPDHQRRGLGRAIMRAGLRLMREAGIRDALVFSFASNAASEALYRSAGFDRVAVHRQYRLTVDP
jgi:ribosomal protein S18 acetylase RimI-like enzyme